MDACGRYVSVNQSCQFRGFFSHVGYFETTFAGEFLLPRRLRIQRCPRCIFPRDIVLIIRLTHLVSQPSVLVAVSVSDLRNYVIYARNFAARVENQGREART